MTPIRVYLAGVAAVAFGFVLSPWAWLAPVVVGVGCVWAAYDLIDV